MSLHQEIRVRRGERYRRRGSEARCQPNGGQPGKAGRPEIAPILSDFPGSAVVSTASVGVSPAESPAPIRVTLIARLQAHR